MNVWLKSAIRYGIPYDIFLTLNPKIMNIYQESYIEKVKEKRETINYTAWLQGQYNMNSIASSMSKKCKYPDKPFGIEKEKENESAEEDFLLWIDEYNRRFDLQEH